MSDTLSFLLWYLAVAAAGLLALPVTFRLFLRLPDRGYAFARPLGLLLVGYVFWFLGSLGFLRNDVPGLLFASLLVGALGLAWLGRPGLAELRAWLLAQRRLVLGVELLFLAAFALLAWLRAHNPEILGTEKPMEYMFINSILRSPSFPPQDAWLSGHAISYYYFGYVIIAALARITATDSAVAFNLGLALLFALTTVAAQGLTFNLIAVARPRPAASSPMAGRHATFLPSLLGPLLVIVAGNFYGLVQLAYVNGWFANTNVWAVRYYYGAGDPANAGLSAQLNPPLPAEQDLPGLRVGSVNFWDWLDLKQAQEPPPFPDAFTWDVGGNWFFGARVVHDRSLSGQEVEAIDEMPAFSFILGDMHPHVLALPFVVVAIGLALEWLLWGLGAVGPPVRSRLAADAPGQKTPLTVSDEPRRMPGGDRRLRWQEEREIEDPPPPASPALRRMPGGDHRQRWQENRPVEPPPAPDSDGPASELPASAAPRPLLTGDDAPFDLLSLIRRPSSVVGRLPSNRLGHTQPSSLIPRLILSALLLGALAFFNTWDFPIYLFLVIVSLALGIGLREGWAALVRDWWRLGLLALGLAVVAVVLYFPFYLTFQSQAGGILPNLIWPTRFHQTVVFFGPVLVIAALYLGWLVWRGWRLLDGRAAVWAGAGLVGLLVLVVVVVAVAALNSPGLGSYIDRAIAPLTRDEAFQLMFVRRLVDSLATIFPALVIGLAAGLAAGVLRRVPVSGARLVEAASEAEPASAAESGVPASGRPWRRRGFAALARRPLAPAQPLVSGDGLLSTPAVLMALAMLLTGALLMLGPEWVYLRDNFGWRMNTIFKFYFQTWTLWALAGAFGLWHLFQHARAVGRWAAGLVAGLAFALSLIYTLPSLYTTTAGLAGPPTLDGMAWFRERYPDEWAAIEWLRANAVGSPVIVEAVGGAYQPDESTISMGTGLPTLMGWSNHEGQWRGDYFSEVAGRSADVQSLYQLRDWNATLAILDRYSIEYVVVGRQERSRYNPVYEPKFDLYMDMVLEAGNLTLYRRKPAAAQ